MFLLKKNRIKTNCSSCGKEINIKFNRFKKSLNNFCNASCYFNWIKQRKKNNPNFGRIKRKCDFCNKKIYVTPYRLKSTKLHFCDKNCFDDWARINKPRGKDSPVWNSIFVNCKNCGKKIIIQPSKLKLVKNTFCSKECYDIWQKENVLHGENHPSWKQKRLTCDSCGKEINRSPALINNHNFCSKSCYYNWKGKNTPKGKNNPRWKEKITVHCAYCNKTIHIKPSLIGTRKNNFCSIICSTNWKKENYPKGIDNPFFNQKKTKCASCGKEIWLKEYRVKKLKYNFCSRDCSFQWIREHTLKGKNSPFWGGGKFYCYGENWFTQKRKILKRAKNVSEISGKNEGLLDVHHIIPLRTFVKVYIKLCLNSIPDLIPSSFRVLKYDLFIPDLIFEEANRTENLICLTRNEHPKFEGMPMGFFEYILSNKK